MVGEIRGGSLDAAMSAEGAQLADVIRTVKAGDAVGAKQCWDAVGVQDEETLVKAGSDDGLTALGLACKLGHSAVVSTLLEHPCIDPNLAKRTTSTLMVAAGRGFADVVQALLVHPRIDVNQKRRDGVTALMLSIQQGHSETTKLLLRHPRLKPSIKALFPERITPLVLAIRQRQAREVALLLQCDRLHLEDNVWMRETPLEYAQSLATQCDAREEERGDSVEKRAARSSREIIELIQAFELGGPARVASLVEPGDRLVDSCCPANAVVDVVEELRLCRQLLAMKLPEEAAPCARGQRPRCTLPRESAGRLWRRFSKVGGLRC
eukprot:TRINITY_DN9935_c0_g1_i1.p1 TRINITY_DN9935_c0_g1~~TRINITY_DN9935_c0_g1_i1.p1  ORF type:complete len:334 (+),score=40.06 TRINITY_DN9935_c0_g1_i1:36-1004(+)